MRTFLLGLLLVALAIPASAQDLIRYQAKPGSKLRLEGTSTLHDWTVDGKIIGGSMELESNFPLDSSAKPPANAKLNAKVEVKIPVTSLLSGKQLMDSVMYEALKEKQYKEIQYRLKSIAPKSNAAGSMQFDATGELTISGMMRTNSMVVTFEKMDSNRVKVKGETTIKMTDFGVKPPAPNIGLGLLKTGDDVKVTFEWITAKKADAAK